MPYGIGSWDADTLGNHRAVVRVAAPADAVFAHIPWRRRDSNPAGRNLIVVDGQSGARVLNVVRIRITREYGDLVFQAPSAGDYFVYYLPNVGSGRTNYPKVDYPEPEATADLAWLTKHGLAGRNAGAPGRRATCPLAPVVEFQAIDELNSFFPMEVIATRAEVADARGAATRRRRSSCFPEDRARPDQDDRRPAAAVDPARRERAVRGRRDARRVLRVPGRRVRGAHDGLDDVRVPFGDLRTARRRRRPAGDRLQLRQHSAGVDSAGPAVHADRHRAPGQGPGALVRRAGARQPPRAGSYAGEVTVRPPAPAHGRRPADVRVSPTISRRRRRRAVAAVATAVARLDAGRRRRARAPYTPVTVRGQHGQRARPSGRRWTRYGFPEQIQSRFAQEMTSPGETGPRGADRPRRARRRGARAPRVPPWTTSGVRFTKRAAGRGRWESRRHRRAAVRDDRARRWTSTATSSSRSASARPESTSLNDIRLEIPLARDVAQLPDGPRRQGRPAAGVVRLEVGRPEQPGLGVARRRQRRPAVHAEGRQVRPAAQHELLHAQAAGDAGVLVQRRQGRVPARREGRRHVPRAAATAARATMRRARRSASTSACCSRRSSRSTPKAQFTHALLPRLQAGRRGRRDRRQHDQRPPRATRSTRTSTTRSSGPPR